MCIKLVNYWDKLKYIYFFFIFESHIIAHDVKPAFVTFAVHTDFRMVNVDILSLCPVSYLCLWMSYSYYKHVVKIKMIKIYMYIFLSLHRAFCRLLNYTHQHMHVYIYIYIYIYIYNLRSLKFTLKHLKRSNILV